MIDHPEIMDDYLNRHPILVSVSDGLQSHLKKITESLSRIDSITARAKDPERYYAKAVKTDEQGNRKYLTPKYDIQDQIGARINVLYLSDVEIVRSHVVNFMNFIEEAQKSPIDDDAFGYVGHHFIFQMPDDIIPDEHKEDVPEFF